MAPDAPDRYAPFRWTRVDLDRHAGDSARLSDIHERWQDRRRMADLPQWDISVLESMPDATIPFVNVIDVNDGVPPFRYRFFGSGLANMHLFELTHQTTDAIEPAGFRRLCEDQHVMTIERRAPVMFINEVPTKVDGLAMSHLMLRLPYSDDGSRVTQILTVEDVLGKPEEVWERFRKMPV
ncbi:MAG: hypothetical protein RIC16_13515 [Rhodospirillales bacterium]